MKKSMNWIKKKPSTILYFIATIVLFVCFFTKAFLFLLLSLMLYSIAISITKKKARNFFIVISALCFGLALCEIFLYFWYAENQKTIIDPKCGYSNNYMDHIKGFGCLPNPGTYTSKKLNQYGDVIYNVTYTIGSDGFRVTQGVENPNIYLYGCSFVFGEGLNDNETLSSFLWRDNHMATKNLGIHGYGLHQALYLISKKNISAHNGINFILTSPFHALRSACKPAYSRLTPRYKINDGFAVLDGVCKGDALFIYKILSTSKTFSVIERVFENPDLLTDKDIDLYFAILRTFARETHLRGSKLMVGYIKASDSLLKGTNYTNEKIYNKISEIADSAIDVTLTSDTDDLDRKYYIHPLDKHPSAAANKARAELITDILKSR